jgi:hypothetical protein
MKAFIQSQRQKGQEPGAAERRKSSPMRYFPLVFLPIVFAIAGFVFIPRMLAERREQALLEKGSPATAEILKIEETGNLYNREPEVVIELKVSPAKGEPFEVEVTKVLAKTELAKYVVGATLDIRHDPADTGEIAIVGLAKPPAASGSTK